MLRFTGTICMALISIHSFGQKSGKESRPPVSKKFLAGMSYIPAKTFNSLVHTGSDSVSTYRSRTVSVTGFYISKTEVTNKEYRDFVHYVRDSVAHVLLQHFLNGSVSIDWSHGIDWNDKRIDAMLTAPDERLYGKKEIDPSKLNFTIDFFGQQQEVNVYPDTLVWMKDFSYSYNEPLVKKYFSQAEFNNYPVVGINLRQAMAFCQWKSNRSGSGLVYRLPSNAEWEAAAIGEKNTNSVTGASKIYPCNFGTIEERNGATLKGYKDDGYVYTAPVKSYPVMEYGLYDIQGNVSEWTATAIDEIMNVEVKEDKQKMVFIVKGGGWNSTAFYLQPGVCQFYKADIANTWTGFRYVAVVKEK